MKTLTRTVELGKWFSGDIMPDCGRSRLFTALMDLSFPVVEHHRSDIYHDALFLSGITLYDGAVLYYGFDAWGTHIGTDEELVHEFRGENVFCITIANTDGVGVWTAEIVEVTR